MILRISHHIKFMFGYFLIIYCFQLLERGLNIETLLMVTADTKPKILHLKPHHYLLLSTQDIPLLSSQKEFDSVECIVVHGTSDLDTPDKEKLNAIFPNLKTHTFLEGEYYECYEPRGSISQENQKNVTFERRDSNSSTASSTSSVSSKSSDSDDFLSADSSN